MFDDVEVKSVEKIDINSGDVLAVYVRGVMPVEILERLKHDIKKEFLPKKINVLVINADSVKMQVIKPAGE